jgi:hypothetical protein
VGATVILLAIALIEGFSLTTGSGLVFTDRGEHRLKGVASMWRIYAVEP